MIIALEKHKMLLPLASEVGINVLVLSLLSGEHEREFISGGVYPSLFVLLFLSQAAFSTHLKSYGKCTIHEIRFLLWDTEAFMACNHGKIPKTC